MGYAALVVIGAALSPGTISGEAGRVLATFLGLFAASVLPTVSLLINSMTASGRSVYSINELEAELEAAMDALFLLFGCIGIAIAALVSLSIQPPDVLKQVPYLTSEVLPRIGQSLVVAAAGIVIWRAGQITGILRRSLKIRHEIAINEAKSKLETNAPTAGAMRQMFPTHPDFGKPVGQQDVHRPDSRQ